MVFFILRVTICLLFKYVFSNKTKLNEGTLYFSFYRSEPYDPYIPNGQDGRTGQNATPNNKVKNVEAQVNEVVGIMQDNIDKAMQRGERMDDLRGKTGKFYPFLKTRSPTLFFFLSGIK